MVERLARSAVTWLLKTPLRPCSVWRPITGRSSGERWFTGSNGKTVIKEWIAEELPAGMKCYRSPKSYNSQLGVPLSVLMIEGDEQLALIEAGISKPGEMARLERIIRPDVVVFTSIGDAHQENFLNLEQKCDEKMVLAHRAETIVYHSYYEPLGRMIASRFAGRKLCDAASCPEVPETLIGNEASRRNARIVEAFCAAMGYPAPSFTEAPEVAMRLEVKDGINDSVLINDAYNLDLNSLALALDYLHNVALSRRRTLVLSDIAQSGLTDDELYGRVAGMVARAGIDTLVGIGPKLKRYAALFGCDREFYASTDECISRIGRRAVAGRAVLLKGAREYRFEKLAHALARKSHTTVLEVDLDAMIHNLNYFRSKLDFRTCGSWRWSRRVRTARGISRWRRCSSIRASTTSPWRSPTRACCCASGGSRCPSWC